MTKPAASGLPRHAAPSYATPRRAPRGMAAGNRGGDNCAAGSGEEETGARVNQGGRGGEITTPGLPLIGLGLAGPCSQPALLYTVVKTVIRRHNHLFRRPASDLFTPTGVE